MRNLVLVVALVAVGCGNKKDGGAAEKAVEAEKAVACKPGEVDDNGTCKVVVTAAQVAAIGAQQTRIEELGALLDKVEVVAAPIEIASAFTKLAEWQALVAKFDQLSLVDGAVKELDNAVKTLRTFRASLAEAQTRLGNLKGEIDKLMTDTGATKKLADVRAQIGAQLRGVLEPLAAQVGDTVKNALAPLRARFDQVSGLIDVGCGGLKLSGGSDDAKKLCEQAQTAFTAAKSYLDGLSDRPIQLYTELAAKLETELDALIDTASKTAIDAAQTQVNELLRLPAAGSNAAGSAGSASK